MPCKLSAQIVEAHGDYVWTAKDNQPELREEIALLFAPQQSRPGWSALPTDFRRATTINKGHGRLEKRTITVSSLLEESISQVADLATALVCPLEHLFSMVE